MRYLVSFDEARRSGIGGPVIKALARRGLPGYLLPLAILERSLAASGLASAIGDATKVIAAKPELTGKTLAVLRQSILSLELPPGLEEELRASLTSGGVRTWQAVAFREDGSWIAEPELFLPVVPLAVSEAIRKAWASVASEQAAFQLERHLPESVNVSFVRASPEEIEEALAPLRPSSRLPNRPCLILQEQVEALSGLELGGCKKLLVRQLLKKVWVRRSCEEAGIETFRIAYAFYRAEDLEAITAQVLEMMRLPFLRLDWGSGPLVTTRDGLPAALADGLNHNTIGCGFTCAQVGEVVPSEAQGLSTVLMDGSVLIEAFPGSLRGTKSGHFAPSTAMVRTGGAIESRPALFDLQTSFDEVSGEPCEIEVAPYSFQLMPDDASAVAQTTRRLAERFGEIRLEWYLYEQRVWVKDVSFESRSLVARNPKVVSPGSALGPVLQVRDCAVLDDAAADSRISVVNHGLDPPASGAIGDLLARIRGAGRPIVVADHPSLGLIPAVPEAAGFVFTRVPLLCHTAIVLRETGCPALALPNAFEALPEGGLAAISEDGVEIISRSAST